MQSRVASLHSLRIRLGAPVLPLVMPETLVFRAEVRSDEILCCVNDRKEQEFIVQPQTRERVKMSLDEMKTHAKRFQEQLALARTSPTSP